MGVPEVLSPKKLEDLRPTFVARAELRGPWRGSERTLHLTRSVLEERMEEGKAQTLRSSHWCWKASSFRMGDTNKGSFVSSLVAKKSM